MDEIPVRDDENAEDCDKVCGAIIDGDSGHPKTCRKTCNKVKNHGGSCYCSVHGSF